MTAKEYRICVSDTPALLASEVTSLLAQGWELYGHPFVAPNGSICQAMLQLSGEKLLALAATASSTATRTFPTPNIAPSQPLIPDKLPAPPQPAAAKPERPKIPATLRNLAILLATLVIGSFAGDVIFFRSGFYNQFLEPLSSTGTLERVLYAELHRPPSGKKDVLVVGNSRLAEGFSARIANEYKHDGFWFANCAVIGSPARAWFYLVRDLDPHRDRYAAIAIPIDDYDDPDDDEDPAERITEMSLVISRLRFTDILPFTFSYKAWLWRFEAFRGSLFKGVVLQRDLYDFLEDPAARLKSAREYREHGGAWFYEYGGNHGSLAGLSVDWSTRQANFPPTMPPDQQQEFRRLMFTNFPQHGYARDFQARWLGALADLYRGSKTKIIVYQVPRNPVPNPAPLVHLPWTTVDELRKRSWVRVVDRHTFEPAERPDLFFDYVHLNSEGRKIFSPLLADTVKECLK